VLRHTGLIHLGDDYKCFYAKVLASAQSVLPEEERLLYRFQAESGLVDNDWSKSPNGEDYREALRNKGRSGLLSWVYNWARYRVETINKKRRAEIEASEVPTEAE
jgi:hypothetical protein